MWESDDDLQWKVCMGCTLDHILGAITVGLAAKLPKDYVAMVILCPARSLSGAASSTTTVYTVGVGAVLIHTYTQLPS